MDPGDFEELYEAQHRRLYAVAHRHLEGDAVAADVVQDAFVKAWQSEEELREHGAWLSTVVVNASPNAKGKSSRLQPLPSPTVSRDQRPTKPGVAALLDRLEVRSRPSAWPRR